MKNDLVFYIRITCKSDFARCSNFISKVLLHQKLDQEETQGILYLRGKNEDAGTGERGWFDMMYREYVKAEKDEQSRLQTIKSPDGIEKLSDAFRVSYLLYIDETDLKEIVQYKELLLLLGGYKHANIYCLVKGETVFYFKLSQYLSLALNSLNLYDKVYFIQEAQQGKNVEHKLESQRLQKEPSQSREFLPLVVINKKNVERLREKCDSLLSESDWLRILSDQIKEYTQIKGEVQYLELGGIVGIFVENREVLLQLPPKEVCKILLGLDILALAFLAYSLKWFNADLTLDKLVEYAEVQQRYANACHQLLENVLFHSVAGWGILSVRMHRVKKDEKYQYLREQYRIESEDDYFEVGISDFSAEKTNKNIAQNFLEHLEERDKAEFRNMCPENLFQSALGGEDQYEQAWTRYYSDEEHLGKHVGLRIFQNITRTNEGFFVAGSHETHRDKAGDVCSYHVPKDADKYVLPGTYYSVLFPLWKNKIRDQKRDVSQEYGDWLTKNPRRLLALQFYAFPEKISIFTYQSQTEKNAAVAEIANTVVQVLKTQNKQILLMNADELELSQMELWIKALVLTAYSLDREGHVVFCHCTDQFIRHFHNVMLQVYDTVREEIFARRGFQIALISEDYEQIIYMPGNKKMADAVNLYYSRIKGIRCDYIINTHDAESMLDRAGEEFIPFDTLVQEDGETLFEKYLISVLERDIQKEDYGCKIINTHMRLGSTIHIDQFYEAELLFGNRYFVSRFAFLMLQEMYPHIESLDHITLYGYASYSEALLVMLRNAIMALNKDKDVDYIILEREEERRGMPHADRIRYGFSLAEDDRKKRMTERNYIVIVPINSTLKTHQRLISLLKEENEEISAGQIFRNYALILIGPKESKYWERSEDRRLKCTYELQPDPQYFVSMSADYQESLTCEMCFPKNPLHEIPLVEVNAASTIPNQAFGKIEGHNLDRKKLNMIPELIKDEKGKMGVLEKCMLYGHIQRNDTHYLYYIKTEELVINAEKKILQSLDEWRRGFTTNDNEYHIIVAPNHFSNCRFCEMVNGKIFGGMATVLRIDFNKEYRSNAYVKYSNIRQYIRQMSQMKDVIIKFHYVDDNIITGRTFYRAKSLVDSIVEQYRGNDRGVSTVVFDRIFTLLDRNSTLTKLQYIQKEISAKEVDNYFYCYLHLEISSLRNYGDSCVVCNLHKEARHLQEVAATGVVYNYWESCNDKFQLLPLADMVKKREEARKEDQEKEKLFRERSYRRMVCTHVAKYILDTVGYDNQTGNASKIILKILIGDYGAYVNKEEAFEYFVSYLKTISRPFLVFNKAVKEAIYDILLIIIEYIIKSKSVLDILKECGDKRYWKRIKGEWKAIDEQILSSLTLKQKRDVVLVIMKQLTEMKSNYIIRLENMNALFCFAGRCSEEFLEEEKKKKWEDFWTRYVILVKKLTGISSDTSKSVWLDYALYHNRELEHKRTMLTAPEVEPMFRQIILLENTVNFQDGIGKMYRRIKDESPHNGKWGGLLMPFFRMLVHERYYNVVATNYFEYWRELENAVTVDIEDLIAHLSPLSAFSPDKAEQSYKKTTQMLQILDRASEELHGQLGMMDEVGHEDLGCQYREITDGYQFVNFLYWLKELGWYDGEKNEFTRTGVVQITGCLLIKYLCEDQDTERTLLTRLKDMTKIAGWVLGDVPAKLWVEYRDSAEFYKEVINETYQRKVLEYADDRDKDKKDTDAALKLHRYYHVIGDNVGYIAVLEEEQQELLNDEEVVSCLDKYSYYYHEEDFIWKIGRDSKYPIYLTAKIIASEAEKKNMIYRIRNLLSMTNDVEQYLEGKQNYLHETELATSRLSVFEREKSLSHTKETSREETFDSIIKNGVSALNDTLVLLADLNVSRVFRYSLNKWFYHETKMPTGLQWKDCKTLLEGSIEEKMHGIGAVEIQNKAVLEGDQQLQDTDEFAMIPKMQRELMSLLLLVILNVKEKGRGKSTGDKIQVYMSRAGNGTLHILNRTECKKNVLKKVCACLEQEPASEESGITLWTLNCYIKKLKAAYAGQAIAQMKEDTSESCKDALKDLTGEEFQIKLDIRESDDESYFLYEIPILRQQYVKWLGTIQNEVIL